MKGESAKYIKGGRKMISVRFDPELLVALDNLAEVSGASRSQLLEEGAELVLRRRGKSRKDTVPKSARAR